MIKYRLKCVEGHEFEGWFPSGASYEAQAGSGQICCPDCGGRDIAKAIMAPSVAARARMPEESCPARPLQPEFKDFLREVRRSLLAASENVGADFAEEARKIHYGEAEARGICGKATGEEARELLDEGIEVLTFPSLPEDAN